MRYSSGMSAFLDWITLHPMAVALAAVIFSVTGYVVTRNVAQKGARTTDDSSAWIMFCQGLHGSSDPNSNDVGDSGVDGGGAD